MWVLLLQLPPNKPLTDEIRLGKFKVRAMMAAKK